jgi:hypothetical protein
LAPQIASRLSRLRLPKYQAIFCLHEGSGEVLHPRFCMRPQSVTRRQAIPYKRIFRSRASSYIELRLVAIRFLVRQKRNILRLVGLVMSPQWLGIVTSHAIPPWPCWYPSVAATLPSTASKPSGRGISPLKYSYASRDVEGAAELFTPTPGRHHWALRSGTPPFRDQGSQ